MGPSMEELGVKRLGQPHDAPPPRAAAETLHVGSLVGEYRRLFGTSLAEDVLDEILKRTYERLRVIAESVPVENPGWESDELLQQAWAEKLQTVLSPRGPEIADTSHFFAVTAKSLLHTACDISRRWRTAKRGGAHRRVVAGDHPAADNAWVSEFWIDFETIVDLLSDVERAVVVRRLGLGLSRAETAGQLGLRESEVRAHAEAATKLLAVRLAEYRDAATPKI